MDNDLFWNNDHVSRLDHERQKEHHSFCLWFTGLSGSGKSTLATAVQRRLYGLKVHTFLLDGDNIRHGLNRDLGFDEYSRRENVRRVAEVCRLFVDAGTVAISALISPFAEDRKMARSIFPFGDFIEVFVDCSLVTCERRDPKGLYKKARAGLIQEFTGIGSPYERPVNPELIIKTDHLSVPESVELVLDYIRHRL